MSSNNFEKEAKKDKKEAKDLAKKLKARRMMRARRITLMRSWTPKNSRNLWRFMMRAFILLNFQLGGTKLWRLF